VKAEEIRELKTYYVDTVYKTVRREQGIDQEYRDDTFQVPEIKDPHHIYRSGIGSRMVDAPAEQIITSNPQASVNVLSGRSDSKSKTEIESRLGQEINRRWVPIMKRANPNPFKEFVKNLLCRGESFIQTMPNPTWVTKGMEKIGMPVFFVIPDPMVVYASPEEDENGVPENVILFYQRTLRSVVARYPYMNDVLPLGAKEKGEVDWLEYFDKDTHYTEVGYTIDSKYQGETIRNRPNLQGKTPFVRKYSGFGRRAPDGELSKLIVSDLRMSRDMIREECAIRSDIASIMHLYAHPKADLYLPPGVSNFNVEEFRENYDMGPGAFNILPDGSKLEKGLVAYPPPEAFHYLAEIVNKLEMRSPFIMAGFPFGSSGRQQDMASTAAMRRYDTVVENTENAFATAYEQGFEIARTVPTLWESMGLRKADSNSKVEVKVTLKASDPVEEDRKATLGERLWNGGNGSIDLRTNLVQYQGKAAEDAEDIIENILVDKLTLYNPDVASVMAMIFAEESGMGQYLEMAKQRNAMTQGQQAGLQDQPTPSGQERSQGETQSPLGVEMIDMALSSKGARNPPARYTR